MEFARPSALFVPADNKRRLDRAWSTPTGAVIADLEDGVSTSRRPPAREFLTARAANGRPHGLFLVRINAFDTPDYQADRQLVDSLENVDGVIIPKCTFEALQGRAFRHPLIALVETAAGLLQAPRIAAHPAVSRLMLGSVDLAAEVGADIDPASPLFIEARARIALASAAAGKDAPIDSVWPMFRDEEGLVREARAARATGFEVKACIHPDQLEAVHRTLAPSAEELAWARSIVSATAGGFATGDGAISVGGEMVDMPVLKRARRLIAQAETLDT